LGTILPLVASGGSIYAWTKWYPPLSVPAHKALRALGPRANPLTTVFAAQHGLSTAHGTLGLVAAIACVAGTVGLFLPGRLKLLAGGVIVVSSGVILANGLSAYLKAGSAQHAWNTATGLARTFQRHGLQAALHSAAGQITRKSLIPAGGATAAGGAGVLGAWSGFRNSLSSLRAEARVDHPRAFGQDEGDVLPRLMEELEQRNPNLEPPP
jgi:hypothetical protein